MSDDKKVIFSMSRVNKIYSSTNKQVLKDIYLSFFYGAKIGILGLNGSGKSSLLKIIAGLDKNFQGDLVFAPGYTVGYLEQEPQLDENKTVIEIVREGAAEIYALLDEFNKINDMFGLPEVYEDADKMQKLMDRQAELQDKIDAAGAWEIDNKLEVAMDALRTPDADTPIKVLSGGEKRRVALCRLLLQQPDVLLLDEPTNHLDADSIIWLRNYLSTYSGGLVIISHDVNLIEQVVNKVFYIDGNRNVIDVYNLGWRQYLLQREQDEHRRKKERANAEKKAEILQKQGEKMRAKASKATAAQGMLRRAEKLRSSLDDVRVKDKVAKLRFPTPAPCGKTPLSGVELSKNYGSLEIFTDVSCVIDKGSRVVILGLNGAGKTTLLKILANQLESDTGKVEHGHGLKLGYYAQEHEMLDFERTILENMMSSKDDLREPEARNVLGSFLFVGDDVHKPVKVLSGGERTRLALATLVVSAANVLLLDEPTNNLDPASRAEILGALGEYQGAVIMVSHDEGAVQALKPERVILLPDGDEDLWKEEYFDLVSID